MPYFVVDVGKQRKPAITDINQRKEIDKPALVLDCQLSGLIEPASDQLR